MPILILRGRIGKRKTPVDILGETGSGISPQVFNLILDNFHFIESVYLVGSSGDNLQIFD